MMVVSDINDVFVPMVDGFLVDLEDSRQVIDKSVSRRFSNQQMRFNTLLQHEVLAPASLLI